MYKIHILKNKTFEEIESDIDNYLIENLDENLPRNSYIYHCNLAFIDIVIDSKLLFSLTERHYLFSLTYNTFLAHKKLKEEETFDYKFNLEIYRYAFLKILEGMQYSHLCDVFPLLHSDKAKMNIDYHGNISFDINEFERKNYKFLSDYTIRKALSYTLQMANGMLENKDDEERALKLSEIYINFWNENMLYDDFEPYTRLDWGGISYFFVVASMRRFNKLYKNDFDIEKTDSQKMMIIISPQGTNELRKYMPQATDDKYKKVLDDNTYRIISRNNFPKLSIADAPLNITKDGYIFANPLVILLSNSHETQYLNLLRKTDLPRHQRIKYKIKERVIPLLVEMLTYKFPDCKVISNFYAFIPNTKNKRRECDLLIVDPFGYAIYVEIKHFYNPISFSETKSLDKELNKALEKIPRQLAAIKHSWENLKQNNCFDIDLKSIKGVIASHQYTGLDVPIDPNCPIVTYSGLFESITESKDIPGIFKGCQEFDLIYPNITMINSELKASYAGYNFFLNLECLDPKFETLFIQSFRKQIANSVSIQEPQKFKSLRELAEAYITNMVSAK